MSCSLAKGAWEVRWRDAGGSQRSRRFRSEEAASEFDRSIQELHASARRAQYGSSGGVYSYETAAGTRWRCALKRSDGSYTSKRGFTSKKAAADARRRLIEKQERGELRHTKMSFAEFWTLWLNERKPHLEPGTWEAYERDGRLRLLPALGSLPLEKLEVEDVRGVKEELVDAMEDGELAAKTINNSLGTLVVCLNAALDDKLIAANPALRVPRLPSAHIERDYLRLHEISHYLDSCSAVYRPLAELLIGSGLRISEALALKIPDLELEESGGVIVVYRSRKRGGTVGSTKSDRFRAVEIGRGLSAVLLKHLEHRATADRDALLFAMPTRVRKRDQGRWAGNGAGEPMDRTTVSRDWHKSALHDAELRDMPLHALRHTAAAAWLAAGNSLAYVQQQLGHSHITTTQRYYGHLERHALASGALATEEAIANASRRARGDAPVCAA
jgi:integrase